MPPQPLKVPLAHLVLKLKELQFLTSEIRFDILKPDFRLQVLDILRTGLESSDGVLALGLGGGLGVLVALVAVAFSHWRFFFWGVSSEAEAVVWGKGRFCCWVGCAVVVSRRAACLGWAGCAPAAT